jgi:cytochrome c
LIRRDGILASIVALMAVLAIQVIHAAPWARAVQQADQSDKELTGQTDEAGKLIKASDCASCHATDRKVVGPAYSGIAKKYAGQAGAPEKLAKSIREGGSGTWGNIPMVPHPNLKADEIDTIVKWILSLKGVAEQSSEAKGKTYEYKLKDGKTVKLDFPLFEDEGRTKVTKDLFRGYELYDSYCYRCHGQDATESELAPDLKHSLEAGMTAQQFLSTAMAGREDKGMPSWAGFFTEQEVRQIYMYVDGRRLELIPVGRPPSEE